MDYKEYKKGNSLDLVVDHRPMVENVKVSKSRITNIALINHLFCKLCDNFIVAPTQCSICLTFFCRSCIEDYVSVTNGICIQGCSFKFATIQPFVKEFIDHFTLDCKFKLNGCPQSLPLTEVDYHEQMCSFRLIECRNQNCKEKVIKRQYTEHAETCQFRRTSCSGCEMDFEHWEYEDYHKDICNEIKIKCSKCLNYVKRQEISTHSCIDDVNAAIREDIKSLASKLSQRSHRSKEQQQGYIKELSSISTKISKSEESLLMKVKESIKTDLFDKLKQEAGEEIAELKGKLANKEEKLEKMNYDLREKEVAFEILSALHKNTLDELKNKEMILEESRITITNLQAENLNLKYQQDSLKENLCVLLEENQQIKNKLVNPDEDKENCIECGAPGRTVKCSKCYESTCENCAAKCYSCSAGLCRKDVKTCGLCYQKGCRQHLTVCFGCGTDQCAMCFKVKCINCEWRFSADNKDKLAIVENNGFSLKALGTAQCSGNMCLGNKMFKSGLHKWEIRVKQPLCTESDFGVLILNEEVFEFDKRSNYKKISFKVLFPFLAEKQISDPVKFTLDLTQKEVLVEYKSIRISKSVSSFNFFLPYFLICNNTYILKQIFLTP